MAWQVKPVTTTMVGTEDLSAKQFFLLKPDATGNNKVLLADTKGAYVEGIAQNDPVASGDDTAVSVAIDGISKCKIGGTVDEGDELISDTDAMAIKADAADQFIFAHARQAGIDGDIIAVRFTGETSHA